MKKSTIVWLVCIAALTLLVPWVTTFFKGVWGMAMIIILLYIVDPLFSFATGLFAGWEWQSRWWLTVVNAVLYLAGAWLFVAAFEITFFVYAVVCLVVGLLAMTGAAAYRHKKAMKK